MPPRIPVLYCLRAQSPSQAPVVSRAFSSTPPSQASTVTQRRKHRDPYAIAQAKARKAANLSRQEVLKKERAAVLGDPVRGVPTPFVQSFDTALSPEPSPTSTSTSTAETDQHLNFFLNKDELSSSIKRSQWLTTPFASESENVPATDSVATDIEQNERTGTEKEIERLYDSFLGPNYGSAADRMRNLTSDETPEQRAKMLEEDHDTAQEALRRISDLSLGSSKDRLRVNVQRCIDTFGRHNTDQVMAPKPPSTQTSESALQKFPRVGPDTGSSEVQIAILTAKIRTLADSLELRGHPDKVNKRNLRLLVHRRAKLLKYLRRKERGGPRWQNLVETLGLTDGTWKGEITL